MANGHITAIKTEPKLSPESRSPGGGSSTYVSSHNVQDILTMHSNPVSAVFNPRVPSQGSQSTQSMVFGASNGHHHSTSTELATLRMAELYQYYGHSMMHHQHHNPMNHHQFGSSVPIPSTHVITGMNASSATA